MGRYLDTKYPNYPNNYQQQYCLPAEKGTLAIFPAGLSHIHRGQISHEHSKTIATGWINAGTLEAYKQRLQQAA
jgi:hypothetical protein